MSQVGSWKVVGKYSVTGLQELFESGGYLTVEGLGAMWLRFVSKKAESGEIEVVARDDNQRLFVFKPIGDTSTHRFEWEMSVKSNSSVNEPNTQL